MEKFYTTYDLANKSRDVENMVRMQRWKGREDELFAALHSKYEKIITAFHQQVYDEEKEAPKDEPDAQPSFDEYDEILKGIHERSDIEHEKILSEWSTEAPKEEPGAQPSFDEIVINRMREILLKDSSEEETEEIIRAWRE